LISVAAALASGSSSSTLSQVEPGALGFLVVAGMGIVLFFLLRNMNKQFKKIGPKPEEVEIDSAAREAMAARRRARSGATVLPGSVVLADGTIQAADAGQARTAIDGGDALQAGDTAQTSDTVQTGDPAQDARAQGASAKRK
jgi:hypothetical protein